MTLLYEDDLTDAGTLSVHASEAKAVEWNDRRALKLVDGLALVPGLEARDVSIDVPSAQRGLRIQVWSFEAPTSPTSSWYTPCPTSAVCGTPCSTIPCSMARTPGSCTTGLRIRRKPWCPRANGSG